MENCGERADLTSSRKGHDDDFGSRPDHNLREALAAAPLILFVINREGTFTLCEGKGLGALGFSSTDVVGRSVFESGAPEIVEATRRTLAGEAFTSVIEMN